MMYHSGITCTNYFHKHAAALNIYINFYHLFNVIVLLNSKIEKKRVNNINLKNFKINFLYLFMKILLLK